MSRKFTSVLMALVFAAVLFIPPNTTQAYFWRNAGEGSAYNTSPANPTTFAYGYGYGSSGFGWGYGYGYSYYDSSKQGTGYYGQASQLTSASAGTVTVGSSNITTNVLDVSTGLSNNAVALSGAGTVTLESTYDSEITLLIPAGVTITGAAGWDGIVQAPTIIASSDTTNYNASYATDSEIVLAGSSSVSITFSSPVTIRIPLRNFDSSKLPYTIYRIPAGSSTPASLTTCTASNIGFATVSGVVTAYCSVQTTSLSRFYGTASTSSTTTTTTSGGGGGGAPLTKLKQQLAMQKLQEEAAKEKATTPSTDLYKAGEVAAPFSDTASHWAKDYVEQLRASGIVHGKSKGQFAPNDKLTRGELVKIALNAFNIPVSATVSGKPFRDVNASDWFAPYVAKAKELNIVQGYNDGTFKANQSINRAEALKILLAASGLEVPMDGLKDLAAKGWVYAQFIDVPINAWYAAYVDFAKGKGIVGGYGNGTFGPQNSVLRGEMAKMAVKTMELAK